MQDKEKNDTDNYVERNAFQKEVKILFRDHSEVHIKSQQKCKKIRCRYDKSVITDKKKRDDMPPLNFSDTVLFQPLISPFYSSFW